MAVILTSQINKQQTWSSCLSYWKSFIERRNIWSPYNDAMENTDHKSMRVFWLTGLTFQTPSLSPHCLLLLLLHLLPFIPWYFFYTEELSNETGSSGLPTFYKIFSVQRFFFPFSLTVAYHFESNRWIFLSRWEMWRERIKWWY